MKDLGDNKKALCCRTQGTRGDVSFSQVTKIFRSAAIDDFNQIVSCVVSTSSLLTDPPFSPSFLFLSSSAEGDLLTASARRLSKRKKKQRLCTGYSAGRQCSFCSDGVMWSRALHFTTNLAADFCRRCDLLIPNVALPLPNLPRTKGKICRDSVVTAHSGSKR